MDLYTDTDRFIHITSVKWPAISLRGNYVVCHWQVLTVLVAGITSTKGQGTTQYVILILE